MNHPSFSPQRHQISATISPLLHMQLEQISIRTGLSRSRLMDLALDKFVAWCEQIDDVTLRTLSQAKSGELGYVRRDSGFRRASTPAPFAPMVETKADPYHVPKSPSGHPEVIRRPALKKAASK